MGAPKNKVLKFTDRDILKHHYNTKIIKLNVYKIKTK